MKSVDRGEAQPVSYAEAMVRFLEEYCPTLKPRSADRYHTSSKKLSPFFGSFMLDEINKVTLSDYISERRGEGVTDSTIMKDLACLSSMFTLAMEWYDIPYNPVSSLNKKRLLTISKPKIRWLRDYEWQKLLKETWPTIKPIVICLYESGMRLNELLSVEHKDVDMDRREIYLNKTKTDSPRTIPMSEILWAQFRAQPRHISCSYVFYNNKGTKYPMKYMSTEISRTFKRAKIKDASAHTLRHTFASRFLQQNGEEFARLQQILGHSRLEQTRKYAHLATEHLHSSIKKMGTKTSTQGTD